MPEGPETRRMADSISKSLVGKEILSFNFFHESLKTLKKRSQVSVKESLSRGKAVLIRINGGQSIITHNQLYGKWTFHRPDTQVKTNRQLRIEFITEKKAVRLWSATDIVLCKTSDELSHSYISKIGPDVLDDSTSSTTILDRLNSKKFRNRQLGTTLLDQSFIAGLGNYLRSEILFFSKLHYRDKPTLLKKNQLTNLSNQIKKVSLRAYVQKGKTLNYDKFKELYGNIENFRKIRHMAFARSRKPCFHCGEIIQREISASRRIYLCIKCQNQGKQAI